MNLACLFAREFDWVLLDEPHPVGDEEARESSESQPRTTWTFAIEITLTTRRHPAWAARGRTNTDYNPLKDEAYMPKIYSLTFEKGRLIEPCRLFYKKPYLLFQEKWYRTKPERFEVRLTFNKSPYPPFEE